MTNTCLFNGLSTDHFKVRVMRTKKQENIQPIQAQITHLSHDGRGIATLNGKITFVQGALPGEIVTFQRSRSKKQWDEGELLEILQPSPQRVTPACPHYHLCGGCSLQHLEPSQQILEKQTWLLELLQRIGQVSPEQILPPLPSDAWHYRSKARLSTRYVAKKQKTLIGFRERNNPRFITEIGQCPILHVAVDKALPALSALIDSLENRDTVAQIEVAAGDQDIALIIRHLTALSTDDTQRLIDFAQQSGFYIFLQPKGPDSIHLLYPHDTEPYLTYSLPTYDLHFYFHPSDFTQVNLDLNRSMVDKALHLLDIQETHTVLDLFCGLGNFSLPIARKAQQVIGIEGCEKMVERAQMNATRNGLSNVHFLSANLFETDLATHCRGYTIDRVLLDPPRSGAFEIVQQIDKIAPPVIVYISCNPATLARDAGVLVNQKNYRLMAAGVMDMFPHTAHVESIAVFHAT